MDKKPLRHFMLACIGLMGTANVGFAQVNGNAPAQGSLLQKIAIGGCVWLVTALLAYVAWSLLKIVAKIGVVVLPILAGVAVAMVLPDQATKDTVIAISIPCVLWGIAASLVCYFYANFYDIERELGQVEKKQSSVNTPPSPPKTVA